jgi:hypothetical protein
MNKNGQTIIMLAMIILMFIIFVIYSSIGIKSYNKYDFKCLVRLANKICLDNNLKLNRLEHKIDLEKPYAGFYCEDDSNREVKELRFFKFYEGDCIK